MAHDYVKIYEGLIGAPVRRGEDTAATARVAKGNGAGTLNAR
jgi:hypothetical protein